MNWREIAELVGIGAIVASLIFVGLQLRQDRQAAFSEIRQNSSSVFAEVQIAIAEHADTLAKANSGEQLSESEEIALRALVFSLHRQTVTDIFEGRRQGGTEEAGVVVFAIWLHRNPGARSIWMIQREDYGLAAEQISDELVFIRDLYDEILEVLQYLDETDI
jgi:hypothetical protein